MTAKLRRLQLEIPPYKGLLYRRVNQSSVFRVAGLCEDMVLLELLGKYSHGKLELAERKTQIYRQWNKIEGIQLYYPVEFVTGHGFRHKGLLEFLPQSIEPEVGLLYLDKKYWNKLAVTAAISPRAVSLVTYATIRYRQVVYPRRRHETTHPWSDDGVRGHTPVRLLCD